MGGLGSGRGKRLRPRLAGADASPVGSDDGEDAVDDLPSRFDKILRQFNGGTGFYARIERQNPRDSEWYYCRQIPFDGDLIETVKSTYGGGRYRVRVVDEKKHYKGHVSFAIAGAPLEPVDPNATAAAGTMTQTDRLLERLAESNQQLAQAVARIGQTPPVDPLEMITRTATVLKAISSDRAQPDMLDVVDRVFQFRDRVLQDAPAGGGDGDSLASAIAEGSRGLFQLWGRHLDHQDRRLEQRNNRPRPQLPPGAARVAAPAGAGGQPVDSSPTVHTVDPNTNPVAELARRIPQTAALFIANAAVRDKDPSLYADLVLDHISEDDASAIVALSTREDFLTTLCATVPGWGEHVEWIAQLIMEIVEAHNAPPDEGDAVEPGAGDPTPAVA